MATSTTKTDRDTLTFEVSWAVLASKDWASLTMQGANQWSPPVQFRFEKHEHDECWDLIMRRVEE